MIVDGSLDDMLVLTIDRIVICGSANLNDRSQLGNRDSEIAVVIQDPVSRPSRMCGHDVSVSSFLF
jgi:phospholipase D1/2